MPSPPETISRAKTSAKSVPVSQKYLSAVQSALTTEDITRAMALRSSVRQTHQQLQHRFSVAYGSNKGELQLPDALAEDNTLEKSLSYYYEVRMISALKQNNPQAAMVWIDQIDQLATEIDQLFQENAHKPSLSLHHNLKICRDFPFNTA